MLRIISGVLLLIISQISFASVSTSVSVSSASFTLTASGYNSSSSVVGHCYSSSYSINSYTLTYSGCLSALKAKNSTAYYLAPQVSGTSSSIDYIMATNGADLGYFSTSQTLVKVYSCSSGYLSDSSGVASSSGQYCAISTSVDSCASYAGQKTYLWVSKTNVPASVCDGTCVATVGSYSNFPDADPTSYQGVYYTYTGQTGSCTDVNTGWVDASTAATANAAADAKALADKINKEISDAETACGGIGHYTTGQVNGATTVVCTNQDPVTNKTETTTTTSGSTTTDTTSTTTNNTGKTTTINPDGTSSTTGGTTNTSGSTTSTTTKTNPDGSTTKTTTTSGATGTCNQSDMKGTAGCAQLGDIPDVPDLPTDTVDAGSFTERAPFADSGQCPADIVITSTLKVSFLPLCNASSMIRPVLLTIAWLVAAYIMRGRNMKEDD